MSADPAALYDVSGGVATITLNRPDNRNCLSEDIVNGLCDNLIKAVADDAVRVIVLTNTGPAFCAGGDLKGGGGNPRYSIVEIFSTILDSPKPVIGRIAGHCMGGGVGLAAACDISVAADDIRLGFTEVRIGVAPAVISVVCLPKMRRGDGMELFLSGERILSTRAAEVGLINYAVPRAELDATVAEIADKVMRGAPKALATAKSLVMKVPGQKQKKALKWTAKLSAELFQTDEAKAGIEAFREKRDAPWVPSKG